MITVKAFCVGQAKSGTASLAGLLEKNFKVKHEPERKLLLQQILRLNFGEISQEEMDKFLLEREQRLQLEYDVAWANQFLIDRLLTLFTDAKFIVLIRHPLEWLESIIGHLQSRNIPADVREFLVWWFKPHEFKYSSAESFFVRENLFPIRSFLSQWIAHITRCDCIPENRKITITTRALPDAVEALSSFLGISQHQLDLNQSRRNISTWKLELKDVVAPDYLDEIINESCGNHLDRFFN